MNVIRGWLDEENWFYFICTMKDLHVVIGGQVIVNIQPGDNATILAYRSIFIDPMCATLTLKKTRPGNNWSAALVSNRINHYSHLSSVLSAMCYFALSELYCHAQGKP